MILTFIVGGISSLAGVGGGLIHLAVLMFSYNYTPKDSTIIVFCCLLGTTLGTMI